MNLVTGFDAWDGHHRAHELQMRLSRLVQLLRLAHLRTGESVTLNDDTQLSSPEDGVRGLKNGHSIKYAVAYLSIGVTRSVPSPGPVVDIEVQLCHCRGRKWSTGSCLMLS